MKRIINLTLIFSVMILSACGNTANKQPVAATSVTSVSGNGKPIQLDKQGFLKRVYDYEKSPAKWVYAGEKPCIIDFYADWCGPCKRIAPYLEEIAGKYNDKLYVYKVNIDQQSELANYFGIQSIPAVLFCPMQGKPQMIMGAHPKEDFVAAAETIIAPK